MCHYLSPLIFHWSVCYSGGPLPNCGWRAPPPLAVSAPLLVGARQDLHACALKGGGVMQTYELLRARTGAKKGCRRLRGLRISERAEKSRGGPVGNRGRHCSLLLPAFSSDAPFSA